MSNTSKSFDELLRKVAAAPDVTMLSLEPGAVLAGRYRILEQLGRGAMGSVYEASDEELGERVALKLLHAGLSADPEYKAALRREVRLARRVSHPNVCRVHDLGIEGDHLFVTMELLSGETLRDHAAATPMSLARRIDILVQIASGLAAAHRAGIVHRDVKPDNVVVEGERAVLTDFGVANMMTGGVQNIAGTPAYMAPELALGKPNDQRGDTYSFGVLAFELLAGRRPVAVKSIADVLALIDGGPRPRLPEDLAEPEVREALEAVLRRALDVDPERRPDPIDTMATLLSRAAGGEAPGTASPTRTSRSTRAATALVVSFAAAEDDSEKIEGAIAAVGGTLTTANRYRLEALFGAPRSRGDDAIRAARAALAVLAAYPDASVAIHTGLVELAADARGALLATGPALERTRDLVGEAGAWCSRETSGQLAGHFRLELELGGRYRLADRDDEIAATATPLAGRSGELAELEALCARSFGERIAGFAHVTGAAGIGKTRLVGELVERIAGRREVDAIWLRAAPFAEAGPLGLLRHAMPSDERPEALRAHLLERAARRPLIVIADDLQWADDASRDFLAELERQVDDAALVGVMIARDPEFLWPPGPRAIELALGDLDREAARDLVIGVAPIAETAAIDRAVERTGNPLLLEELGRALRAGRKSLPDTVVAAAQELLDQLDDWCRDITRRAAVLGGDFNALELGQLADLDTVVTPDTDGAIAELIERGVLTATVDDTGEVRYRFASPLVRDTAYEMTSRPERKRWHAAAAAYFESLGNTADLVPIADHWERAGEPDRAREVLCRAGERALARFAFDEAAAALMRAEGLTRTGEVGVDLLISLGQALELSDGAAAEERYSRAFRETGPGDPRRPQLCLYLGRRAGARSDNEAARIWYERGLAAVESADPPAPVTIRAALYGTLGSLHGYVMNDNETGLELSERAVALLEGTEHRRELAGALSQLGGNYMRAGRIREQLECNRRNLDIARELADPVAELTARVNLGEAHKTLGELEAALEHTRIAVGLSRRLGNSMVRALALNNLGLLLLETGDLDAAAERIRQSLKLGRRVGFERFFYESYIGLCRIHYQRGQNEQAEETARKAVGIAISTGSEVLEGITLRFLAASRAARGQLDDALRHLRRAHRCLGDRDPVEHARTLVVEARVLRRNPGSRDPEALREKARETFERLGAQLDLAHIGDVGDLR